MSFAPQSPLTHLPPSKVAVDTWVIHSVQEAVGEPLHVHLDSMVILGEEPVIVDAGIVANRERWLSDVFSLVEPQDVRWVFLSHDDVDHTGNLEPVMEACPHAKLVASWAILERHGACFSFPLERCHWALDGESLDVGDRTLLAARPPVYDAPTTRALFDPTTGVLWAADMFATPVPHPEATVADLDEEYWDFGMTWFAHGSLSPWLRLVDPEKYGDHVDRIRRLGVTTVAGCHTPVIHGAHVDHAFELVRRLPTIEPPEMPELAVLEQVVAMTAQPPP